MRAGGGESLPGCRWRLFTRAGRGHELKPDPRYRWERTDREELLWDRKPNYVFPTLTRWAILTGLLMAGLFLAAGTTGIPMLRAYIAVFFGIAIADDAGSRSGPCPRARTSGARERKTQACGPAPVFCFLLQWPLQPWMWAGYINRTPPSGLALGCCGRISPSGYLPLRGELGYLAEMS
jgi:hypothetical protein